MHLDNFGFKSFHFKQSPSKCWNLINDQKYRFYFKKVKKLHHYKEFTILHSKDAEYKVNHNKTI